jgi:ribonuclease R
MIAANEAVANFLSAHGVPTLYRIHEPPNSYDLTDLFAFLDAYHIPHKKLNLSTPTGLNALLNSMDGSPLKPVVSNMVLRSLKLAVYSTKNAGHFGLALKSYCHFTSPIRRYPDLLVHRSLKKFLRSGKYFGSPSLEKLALHCSLKERAAEKAERECQRVLQLRFMEKKINQRFEGQIRHITSQGVYMELEPFGIEGLLPLENLKEENYQLDPQALILRGRNGRKLQIGDRFPVKVVSVDMVYQRLTLARAYD